MDHLFFINDCKPLAVRLPALRLSVEELKDISREKRKRKRYEEEFTPSKKRKKVKEKNVKTKHNFSTKHKNRDKDNKIIKEKVKKAKKPRARPEVAVIGTKSVPAGPYTRVCKFGRYQCPLCGNRWSLNQTYGRHVVSRPCQEDLPDTSDSITDHWLQKQTLRHKLFFSVNAATIRNDSFVSTSQVPGLKMLSRGVAAVPGAPPEPPVTVKEGLEYYHTLAWPANYKEDRYSFFRHFRRAAGLSLVSSWREYETLCKEPLKVALYLEKKISRARERQGARHTSTARWVEKYRFYLSLPLHDIFLSVTRAGYRVLEVGQNEAVRLLCLVCPRMDCNGCLLKSKPAVKPAKKTKKVVGPKSAQKKVPALRIKLK